MLWTIVRIGILVHILCKLDFIIIKHSTYCYLFVLSTLSDLFIKYNQHHSIRNKIYFHNLRIHITLSKTILAHIRCAITGVRF